MTTPVRSSKVRHNLLWPFIALVFWLGSFLPLLFSSQISTENSANIQKVRPKFINQVITPPDDSYCNTLMHIEAEDYNRIYGVRTEICDDFGGGWNIAWINDNDFTSYKVHIPVSGLYNFHFRVASATDGGEIEVLLPERKIMHLSVPGTSGWHNWQTVGSTAALAAGDHEITLKFSGKAGYLFNLNWFEMELMTDRIVVEAPGDSDQVKVELTDLKTSWGININLLEKTFHTVELQNLGGQSFFSQTIDADKPEMGVEISKSELPDGVYFLIFTGEHSTYRHKMLIF
jgi:hypothetical protein